MKNLIFVIGILVSTVSFGQTDSLYCVQLMSTRNVHLVKPEMVSMAYDTVVIEGFGEWDRLMVPYSTLEEAEIMLWTWKRVHEDAFIVRRSVADVKKMSYLFTW